MSQELEDIANGTGSPLPPLDVNGCFHRIRSVEPLEGAVANECHCKMQMDPSVKSTGCQLHNFIRSIGAHLKALLLY